MDFRLGGRELVRPRGQAVRQKGSEVLAGRARRLKMAGRDFYEAASQTAAAVVISFLRCDVPGRVQRPPWARCLTWSGNGPGAWQCSVFLSGNEHCAVLWFG